MTRRDVFLSLEVFAFEGQSMKFTMNMQLTCILYCDTWSGCEWNCLQAQLVDSYHRYHICRGTFFFGDAVALLRERYTFVYFLTMPMGFNLTYRLKHHVSGIKTATVYRRCIFQVEWLIATLITFITSQLQ